MEDFSHSFRRNEASVTLSTKISNENGFSAKTVYDDVFGGPPKFGVPTFSSRVEDYSEIFGGFHSSKRSSIPILDLPDVDERDVFFDVQSSRFDYSEVFGGSADVDFAIPYEDLFAEPKGLETSSEEAWTPAETGSPSEGSIEDPFPCTDKSQCLSNGTSHRSLDGTKQFNISYHKKMQKSKEDETTHITQLPAVPGFSVVVGESTPLQETEGDKSLRPITNGRNVSMDFSGGIMENSYIKKTVSQPPISSAVKSDIKPEKGAGVNRSYRNESFVTVSEINLRTNPSQVPAPSRPPPKLAIKKGNSKKFMASNLKASDSFSHEGSAGDVSPPFFDVEVDASSSAAASAAAMKEAMVKAEARLKYAKEFMQRNDSLQSMKLRLKDDLKGKEKKEVKAAQFEEETKETFEQKDSKVKGFAKEERQKVMRVAQGALDSEEGGRILTSAEESAEKKHRRESRSIQESYKQEERVGDWIAEKQFYELVNTERFRAVPDTSGQAKNEKKMMTTMRADEHEQNEKKAATNTSFGWQEESDTKLKEVKEPLKLKENKWKPMAAKETDKWEDYEKKLKEAEEVGEWVENEKQVEVAHEDGKREEKLNEAIEREHDWKIKESYKQKKIERKLKEASELEESEKKIKEALEQEENKRKQKEAFEKEETKKRLIETYEQEENEKKRKEILEREENEKRLKEANEQVENEKRQIEIRQREENEKRLKEAREENERRLREANERVENEKRLQEAREQAENEKRQIEIRQREENEKRLKEAREENERRLREANERLENEKRLEEAREQAENEKRQIEIRQREENEKRLKEAREENERRLREAREQEEIEKCRKEVAEKEENEKRQKEARELEENEKRQKDACEREENIKRLKKALEREENEKRQKEARDMEENEKRKQDAFDREENEEIVKEAVKLEECEQQLNETHEKEEKSRQKETCDREASNIKLKGTQDADEHKEESMKAACKSEEQEDNKVFKAIQEAAKHEKNRKTMKVGGYECGESEKEFQETNVANEQVESERVGVSHIAQSALENEEDGKRRKNDTDDREKKFGEPQLEMPQMTSQLEENGKNIKEAQVAFDCEENRIKVKAAQPVKHWVENGKKMETAALTNALDDKSNKLEIAKDAEKHQGTERREKKPIETFTVEDTVKDQMQGERKHEVELLRKIEEEWVREKEREKDRIAVERATREARERAERAAVERATAEARQRAMAEARERLEKASAEAREKSLAEKAFNEARLRVERAAVERATAEARERAAEKAALLASKRAERSVSEKFSSTSRDGGMRHTSSFSDLRDSQFQSSSSSSHLRYPNSSNRGASYNTEKFQVSEGESAQRCKARLERHQRTVERAAKALAEKNMRDLLAQREQTERNRLSETLDADVRRWCSGKEGNLRALLSTLQYILGPDSGWQPIPLTEVITAVAVKKAYRKATLCVHPDKLQQRGASIQQKYICEKVFDLLKEAWNKFNSEER